MRKPITDVMREIRSGRLVEQASDEMAAVVMACQETGKPGTITIKLTIAPEENGAGTMQVHGVVTAKAPRAAIPKATFFATIDGDLLRENPDAAPLFQGALRDESRSQSRGNA